MRILVLLNSETALTNRFSLAGLGDIFNLSPSNLFSRMSVFEFTLLQKKVYVQPKGDMQL
jgi:hypothetical protein